VVLGKKYRIARGVFPGWERIATTGVAGIMIRRLTGDLTYVNEIVF
jgi:hypothetical protein